MELLRRDGGECVPQGGACTDARSMLTAAIVGAMSLFGLAGCSDTGCEAPAGAATACQCPSSGDCAIAALPSIGSTRAFVLLSFRATRSSPSR